MKFIKLRNQEFQINVQKFLLNFPNLHSPLNLHTRDPIGYRSFPNIDIVNACVPRMYPDLPPPSYAESVWGVANVRHAEDEHTMGDWEFVPRYVTYNTQY